MTNPFIRKLENVCQISDEQRRELDRLTRVVRHLGPRDEFVEGDDGPHVVNIVLSGWAIRYRDLPDGRRQVIAILLPGDMCDPFGFLLRPVKCSFRSLTKITLAQIPVHKLRELADGSPGLTDGLWWQSHEAGEIQREKILSLGRRLAIERLAHFFCELFWRSEVTGHTEGSSCDMPITQENLGHVLGISTVQANRSLQELRERGLIRLADKRLTVIDSSMLAKLAMFDPTYLRRRAA